MIHKMIYKSFQISPQKWEYLIIKIENYDIWHWDIRHLTFQKLGHPTMSRFSTFDITKILAEKWPFRIDLESYCNWLKVRWRACMWSVQSSANFEHKNLQLVTLNHQNEFHQPNSTCAREQFNLWFRNSVDFLAFRTMRFNATRGTWLLSRPLFHLVLVPRLHSAALRKLQTRPLRRFFINLVPSFLALRWHVS